MSGVTAALRRLCLPRNVVMIMAASAAMIVVGAMPVGALAQTADQAPAPSNSLALVNKIASLQAQMQQMQGQIEVLQHQLQQLQQADQDRYGGLAERLTRLEQAGPASAASSATPVASAAPATSTAPKPSAPAVPMSADAAAAAQAAYQAAFKSLRANNYVESARGFRAFIDTYPQSPLVSNAYYWLGGSYYVTGNYKVALTAFRTLLEKYPASNKAPEAHLRVAECQIGMRDYQSARATLQAVINAYPDTPLEQRARDKLRELPASVGAK